MAFRFFSKRAEKNEVIDMTRNQIRKAPEVAAVDAEKKESPEQQAQQESEGSFVSE